MTRTLLIIDPIAIFVEPEHPDDYGPSSHIGWSGDAPISRRALEGWAEVLTALHRTVNPEVTGVIADTSAFPAYASAMKTLQTTRLDRGGVQNLLPIAADSVELLVEAIAAVDFEPERIVIVTGGRDAEYVEELKTSVTRRTVVATTVLNAGAAGLLHTDISSLSA